MGEVGKRGMPVEVDPVWRGFSAASLAAICCALSRGTKSPRTTEPASVSATRKTSEHERRGDTLWGAIGWTAEILRARGGLRPSRSREPSNEFIELQL